MSKEALLRFRDAVMRDAALQAELAESVKSTSDLIAMGKRLGFDVEAADVESRELTEDELKQVAGGIAVATEHQSWVSVRAFDILAKTSPR